MEKLVTSYPARYRTMRPEAPLRASLRGSPQPVQHVPPQRMSRRDEAVFAIADKHWRPFAAADVPTLAKTLLDLARRAHRPRYQKSPRGPRSRSLEGTASPKPNTSPSHDFWRLQDS